MTKKKVSKAKKVSSKPKKDIDINDIDAMLEDMKNLALEKTEEKKETESLVEHEDTKEEEIVENFNEEIKDDVVVPTDENVIFADVDVPVITIDENKEEVIEAENIEKDEEIQIVVEDVKEEQKEEKKEEKPKSRRMTYQEMFGGTWRGYGYDHF